MGGSSGEVDMDMTWANEKSPRDDDGHTEEDIEKSPQDDDGYTEEEEDIEKSPRDDDGYTEEDIEEEC